MVLQKRQVQTYTAKQEKVNKMKKTKMRFLLILAAISAAAILVSCSSDDGNSSAKTKTAYPIAYFDRPKGDEFCDTNEEHSGDFYTYKTEQAGNKIKPDEEDDFCSGLVKGGAEGSKGSLHITGVAATGGDGVGLVGEFESKNNKLQVRDFSKSEGISLWAKGKATMLVSLAMPELIPEDEGGTCKDKCYDYHGFDIDVNSTSWKKFTIPFVDLNQGGWGKAVKFNPAKVAKLQIDFPAEQKADKTGKFDVYLDEIVIYGGDPWPDMPIKK
jgi:hypothetical protein